MAEKVTKGKAGAKAAADTGEFENIDVEDVDGAEFDLDNVSDVVYELIPRAVYPAEIVDAEFTTSSNGNPMWTMRLRITDGEYKGRTLFNHQVFTDQGLPRVKQFLQRVAPDLAEGSLKPAYVADEGLLEGRACSIRVGVQRYEGQKRNNIREILAPEGAEAGFLDE